MGFKRVELVRCHQWSDELRCDVSLGFCHYRMQHLAAARMRNGAHKTGQYGRRDDASAVCLAIAIGKRCMPRPSPVLYIGDAALYVRG